MDEAEAREILYSEPKDQEIDAEQYARLLALAESGDLPGLRVNDHGEIVLGGLTHDYYGHELVDPIPTIRYRLINS